MNTTKHYADKDGNSLGSFVGAKPPQGSIEVPSSPNHGLDIWNGKSWDDAKPTQATVNRKSEAYLASTDWYVLRMAETQKAIPDVVLKARDAARAAHKNIE